MTRTIYLKAFDPDRKILNMIHPTKPITLYIYHVALYYRWDQKNGLIDFEKDRTLTSYLLMHSIENISYIWLKSIGNQIEKVKVSNLLEYHYLESKQDKESVKCLKELPSL